MPQLRDAEIDAITKADEVFVIGYSMPKTDQDQWDLIHDAIGQRREPISKLTIINYRESTGYFEDLKELFQPLCCPTTFNGGFAEFAERATRRWKFESNLGFANLAPQSGHVSNFFMPNLPLIEPANEQCFEGDPR